MDGEKFMDWSKAKNILIIAFIITNLLLGYALIQAKKIHQPSLTDEFVENVKNLLIEKNIKIEGEIPLDFSTLSLLTIEYEYYSPDKLAAILLGEYKKIDIDGVEYYKNEEAEFTILDNKKIVYERSSDGNNEKIPDKIKAINIAEDFLKKNGFSIEDMKLSDARESEDGFFLEYTKIYKNIYVEKTYTKFLIDSQGVKNFERYWINVIESSENNVEITPAPRALLSLLTMKEYYGKTIEDISICYYFDPTKHLISGNPNNAKMGKAAPAWRIKFKTGEKIFLEEY